MTVSMNESGFAENVNECDNSNSNMTQHNCSSCGKPLPTDYSKNPNYLCSQCFNIAKSDKVKECLNCGCGTTDKRLKFCQNPMCNKVALRTINKSRTEFGECQ